MGRIIDPPRNQHNKLPTPLTEGEKKVVDLFDEYLPPEWEIYVQPHLNGLRPDIVLLNPKVGIAVFEIKDWDLNAMHYYAETFLSDQPVLMARDKTGNVFSLEATNPINQILLYKEELFHIYCPRVDHEAGLAVITAGIIFPNSKCSEVKRVFDPFRKSHKGMRDYPIYYPISGMEDVNSANLPNIFPESSRKQSTKMDPMIAEDLRGWLKEPYFSQEQRIPLELDVRQQELANTRTATGYRRIKGPAGSGKSLILAARAANLAAEGKHTLVVSYNITLLNYLRDLAVRHTASRRAVRYQIDFLNFHSWCKRVCFLAGHGKEYNNLFLQSSDGIETQNESALKVKIPLLVQRIYLEHSNYNIVPRYDAILVDEGQDFLPDWWETLRAALKNGGEMILAADKTQNVYETAKAWTEGVMEKSGFRGGRWAELKISYRLPPTIIPLVSSFAQEFMTNEEIDYPIAEKRDRQMELVDLFPVELRWVQVDKTSDGKDALVEEVLRIMKNLREDTAVPDIYILTGKELGRSFVDSMKEKGVEILNTFDEDKRNSRRQKLAFRKGTAKVKATTIHSFKGWEARHLLIFASSIESPKDRALVYTSLTRLQRHENGSTLTVVSCCPELLKFGRSWPEFIQFKPK